MGLISDPQDLFSGLPDIFGKAVVHGFRRQEADTRMPMLFVIPREEVLAVAPGVLDAAEPFRKVRPVLEGFELGLGVRVVIARIGPAMGLGDPHVGQQERHWLQNI